MNTPDDDLGDEPELCHLCDEPLDDDQRCPCRSDEPPDCRTCGDEPGAAARCPDCSDWAYDTWKDQR